MAQNKNSLIRFKTIDKCLKNHKKLWTLEKLIEECSKALSASEQKDVVISKRSVQLDIQMMRSADSGYNAPIEVFERKYYRYTDKKFSILKLPLSTHDKALIEESLNIVSQFDGFDFYEELKQSVLGLQKLVSEEREEKAEQKVKKEASSDKIIIEVQASLKDAFVNNPLHISQKIKRIKKNGNVHFQYKMKNLSMFQARIVHLGTDVKVISPKSLKKDIKKALKAVK